VRPPRVPTELTTAPFTPATAARFGLSATALRTGPWVRAFHGVWRHRDLSDTRECRVAAARLLLTPNAVICGLTSAWLQGIDVQDRRTDQIWVACRTGSRMRARSGVAMRELTLIERDIGDLDGLPVTVPVRTAFDCARWLAPTEAVVVIDALSHAHQFCLDDLRDYVAGQAGLRWISRVRAALDRADPRSESPMETRLRLLFFRNGITSLVPQVVVTDGSFTARLDLADEKRKVAVEYDGAAHWLQRRDDDRRRDRLRALGWTVIVVSAEDYYEHPEKIIAVVRAALSSR
jgi:very-short-patch-repair endonuclease